MPTNILMSGPIRPSEDAVLEVIDVLRKQIPDSRIFLATWSESDAVRAKVDVYQAFPEPSNDEILRIVTGKTRQHRLLNLPDAHWSVNPYKMFRGVNHVCDLAMPFVSESDTVIRIRTDCIIRFDREYLQELLTSPHNDYVVKHGDGLDWFAITRFSNLLQTWDLRNIDDYNREIELAWNTEDLVRFRVPVPIRRLDPTRTDTYILRAGGVKHYFT
jgi:hypothetical protein